MSLLLAVLAATAPEQADVVVEALRFLARHQRLDGSWGRLPQGCTCPEAKPPAKASPERVATFIQQLDANEIERRDEAERKLRAIGESALPHMLKAADSGSHEVRGRCRHILRDLAVRGTEPGDVRVTALAVYAFLAAGYTHRVRREGAAFADVVRRGLQWLVALQKEDGAFDPEDATGHIVASEAVRYAYSRTRSYLLVESARKGREYAERISTDEPTTRLWQEILLYAARQRRAQLRELVPRFAKQDDPKSLCAAVIFAMWGGTTLDHSWVARIYEMEIWNLDGASAYLATAALRIFHWGSPFQKNWRRRLDSWLQSSQQQGEALCYRGSWNGSSLRRRLETTAYIVLTLKTD